MINSSAIVAVITSQSKVIKCVCQWCEAFCESLVHGITNRTTKAYEKLNSKYIRMEKKTSSQATFTIFTSSSRVCTVGTRECHEGKTLFSEHLKANTITTTKTTTKMHVNTRLMIFKIETFVVWYSITKRRDDNVHAVRTVLNLLVVCTGLGSNERHYDTVIICKWNSEKLLLFSSFQICFATVFIY